MRVGGTLATVGSDTATRRGVAPLNSGSTQRLGLIHGWPAKHGLPIIIPLAPADRRNLVIPKEFPLCTTRTYDVPT